MNKIAPRNSTIERIKEKFGREETERFLKEYDIAGNLEALTEREASYILKFGSLDTLRARATKEGFRGSGEMDGGATEENEVDPDKPRFKRPSNNYVPHHKRDLQGQQSQKSLLSRWDRWMGGFFDPQRAKRKLEQGRFIAPEQSGVVATSLLSNSPVMFEQFLKFGNIQYDNDWMSRSSAR